MCQAIEILSDAGDGNHDIVDVGEGQSTLGLVLVFCGKEGGRMGFPMAAWVEVMGGMVAVVEAVAVGLR